MSLKPHSDAWYDRLATLQSGYFYPWRSTVPPHNGEDTFLAMLNDLLAPEKDVLEVGCGHGAMALAYAPRCRSVLAVERVPAFVELARQGAQAQGLTNVQFVCNDGYDVETKQPRMPAAAHSFDLLISRRGPLHWVEDAKRVGRPGAVLLMLNPVHAPLPEWNSWLPPELQIVTPPAYTRRQSVERALAAGGLQLESCWSFDVPEWFDEPLELYRKLAFGLPPEEAPGYEAVEPVLARIFNEYGENGRFPQRFCRFLWQAVVK